MSGLRRLQVEGVRVLIPSGEVMLVLRPLVPREGEERLILPVSIGPSEGAAIAAAQHGTDSARPSTHELMLDLIRAGGQDVGHVVVRELRDGIYFADVVLVDGMRVDARTSDAVALALRAGATVLCRPEVLDEGGVIEPEGDDEHDVVGAAPTAQADVERFRDFLADVEPHHFQDRSS